MGDLLAIPSLAFSTADVLSVEHPNQVFSTCHDGYSLDGKWKNASNVSSTNMRFSSACTRDGYFSVLENPCVPVSCARRGIDNRTHGCHHPCLVTCRISAGMSWDWAVCQLRPSCLARRRAAQISQRLTVRTARSHPSRQLHASQGCVFCCQCCRIHVSSEPCADRSFPVLRHIASVHLQAIVFDQG